MASEYSLDIRARLWRRWLNLRPGTRALTALWLASGSGLAGAAVAASLSVIVALPLFAVVAAAGFEGLAAAMSLLIDACATRDRRRIERAQTLPSARRVAVTRPDRFRQVGVAGVRRERRMNRWEIRDQQRRGTEIPDHEVDR